MIRIFYVRKGDRCSLLLIVNIPPFPAHISLTSVLISVMATNAQFSQRDSVYDYVIYNSLNIASWSRF